MPRTPRARSERPSAVPPPRPRLDGARLVLGREVVPFRAGSVDAFRLDPRAWPTALASVRSLGLGLVDVRVPWGVHTVGPDELEFGAHDPRRDLGRFLDLAAEAGLRVVVRVGPHVGPDVLFDGLPDHVVRDRRMHARTARGNPIYAHRPPRMYALPSYASSHFRDAVKGWYAALSGVVGPRCFPHGPVVATVVDHGCGPHATRSVHGFDHHPEALDGYRRFLAERYATVESLVSAHHLDVQSFDDVLPPLRFDERGPLELRRHLDWAEYQEVLVAETLALFRRHLSEVGIDVPCIVGLPAGSEGAAIDATVLPNAFDAVGLPFRADSDRGDRVRRSARRARGLVSAPLALPFALGSTVLERPLTPQADRHTLLTALAHGIRGFSLDCVVERDRWVGAPFDVDGAEAPFAEGVRQVLRMLDEIGFEGLSEPPSVAIAMPRTYVRLLRSTHLLGPVDASTLAAALGSAGLACRRDALMDGLDPIEVETYVQRLDEALTAQRLPYVLLEGDVPQLPDSIRLVFVPSLALHCVSFLEALASRAERGLRVVLGPRVPSRDLDHPIPESLLSRFVQAPLPSAQAARELVTALSEELGLRSPLELSEASVETSLHSDETGPRVLFVRETTGQACVTELSLEGASELVDLRTGERFALAPSASLALEPHEIRVLRIERAQAKPKARRSTRPPRSRRPS